jgi:hypothetical protein
MVLRQTCLYRYICLSVLLTAIVILSGCNAHTSHAKLAPQPPQIQTAYLDKLPHDEPRPSGNTLALANIEPAAGSAKAPSARAVQSGYNNAQNLKGCSVQDRFDKDAALAYQWGRSHRNRVSLDVDGLEFSPFGGSSADIEQVRIEYRLKLQGKKSKKERCRGHHNWQGLIGTGYRELIDREENTVWDEANQFYNEYF